MNNRSMLRNQLQKAWELALGFEALFPLLVETQDIYPAWSLLIP
jgi:hypothetical protein